MASMWLTSLHHEEPTTTLTGRVMPRDLPRGNKHPSPSVSSTRIKMLHRGQDRARDRIIDVSEIFWQFVSDVTTMSHSRLTRTTAFRTLTRTRHDGFGLCSAMLGPTSQDDIDKALDTGEMYYDASNDLFVFVDVSSLMQNSTRIVSEPGKRKLLNTCLSKIRMFVDAADLAQELELHPLCTV